MRNVIGYILSFIEEIFFMGFIAFLLCFCLYDLSFVDLQILSFDETNLLGYFYTYLYISIIGYPIIMAIGILFQKIGLLYDGEYKRYKLVNIFVRNLADDITFFYYLLRAIVGIIKKDSLDPKNLTLFFFALWVLDIIFIICNIALLFIAY